MVGTINRGYARQSSTQCNINIKYLRDFDILILPSLKFGVQKQQ